mgnify:CR=1 FL=1
MHATKEGVAVGIGVVVPFSIRFESAGGSCGGPDVGKGLGPWDGDAVDASKTELSEGISPPIVGEGSGPDVGPVVGTVVGPDVGEVLGPCDGDGEAVDASIIALSGSSIPPIPAGSVVGWSPHADGLRDGRDEGALLRK